MTRRPAGLLIRSGAFALDYLLIAAYLVMIVALGALLRLLAPSVAATLFGGPLIGELSGFLALTLPISLYFVLHEASPAGATWGKRRLGLRVVDAAGGRLGLGRSALRTALKFPIAGGTRCWGFAPISHASLGVSHAMCSRRSVWLDR